MSDKTCPLFVIANTLAQKEDRPFSGDACIRENCALWWFCSGIESIKVHIEKPIHAYTKEERN